MFGRPAEKPIPVGFWRSTYESDLPDPRAHVDGAWDFRERDAVVTYLERKDHERVQFRGSSQCRMCGITNGSADVTDGVYVWPSGLAHYLTAHEVKPPSGFLQHVLRIQLGR